MINLNDETGKLIYCDWGKDKILLMKGDPAFIKRTINLCHNYSIGITNTIHKFFDNSSYIITTESKLLSGLNDYFVAQIIFDKEILPEEQLDEDGNFEQLIWDDKVINELAAKRTIDFFMNKIVKEPNYIQEKYKYAQTRIREYKVCLPKSNGVISI